MKYKILLIEGSPERADEMERPLVSAGYELLVCRSRDQVDEALPERPDLALIASEGQGEAVSDLCRAVRDAHAATPVVLLGGSSEESPGFDDYLREPVTATALVALCARLLGSATIDPREESRQLENAIDHLGRQRVGRRFESRPRRSRAGRNGASQTDFAQDFADESTHAPVPAEEPRNPETLTEADIEGVTSALLAGPSIDEPSRIPDLPGEVVEPTTEADIDAHLDMLFATGDAPTATAVAERGPVEPSAAIAASDNPVHESETAHVGSDHSLPTTEHQLDPELIIADDLSASPLPSPARPAPDPSQHVAPPPGPSGTAPAFQTATVLGSDQGQEVAATNPLPYAAPIPKLGTRRVAMLAGACVIVITAVLIFFAQKRASAPPATAGDGTETSQAAVVVASAGTAPTVPEAGMAVPIGDEQATDLAQEAQEAQEASEAVDAGEPGPAAGPPRPKPEPVAIAPTPTTTPPATAKKPSSSKADRRPSPKPIETARSQTPDAVTAPSKPETPKPSATAAQTKPTPVVTAEPAPTPPEPTAAASPVATPETLPENVPENVPESLAVADSSAEPATTSTARASEPSSTQPTAENAAAPEPAPISKPETTATIPPAPTEGFAPPEITHLSEPNYSARDVKQAGFDNVVLRVLVNDRGMVVRVVVQEGEPGSVLVSSAIDAVLRSTFRPATEDGQPVQAWKTETFSF